MLYALEQAGERLGTSNTRRGPMKVSAEELRQAAGEFDKLVTGVGNLPTMAPGNTPGLWSGVTGETLMAGSRTAPVLDRIETVRATALKNVGDRYEQFASLLRVAADSYTNADAEAATWFYALGDFNGGEASA
ncbi:type VII secretion target [Nocardia otitidiscaviarum]|uniref:type VII secretion target n=1 Tax=Nocardia otitidiscaviarum TaxID=1823 RepID=UPI001893879D|nr:type VII secretion target [Nocardia otitidiscaviarum]MBF6181760.1 hypothetical protein [Nocardia otitidiscaviarum]